MNPNARTKPTELSRSREGTTLRYGTRLIKYKLEPRIAATGGRRCKENNAFGRMRMSWRLRATDVVTRE